MTWQIQRLCTDVGDYELIVEKQKTTWECEQKRDQWKWNVVFHGTVLQSGLTFGQEDAKEMALSNVPKDNHKTDDNCGCD